jgi:hypothetical protein
MWFGSSTWPKALIYKCSSDAGRVHAGRKSEGRIAIVEKEFRASRCYGRERSRRVVLVRLMEEMKGQARASEPVLKSRRHGVS